MAIPFIELLSAADSTFKHTGPLFKNIGRVSLSFDDPTSNASDTLFIISESSKSTPDNNLCILYVPEERIQETYQDIVSIIFDDYSRSCALSLLGSKALSKGNSIEDLAKLAWQIMKYPVVIADMYGNLSASVGIGIISATESMLKQGIEKCVENNNCIVKNGSNELHLQKIEHNGKVCGYFGIIISESETLSTSQFSYIQEISIRLSARENLSNIPVMIFKDEELILDILRGSITDKTAIEKLCFSMNLPKNKKYYVLTVVTEGFVYSAYTKNMLSNILHTNVYLVNNNFTAIISVDRSENIDLASFPELEGFLKAKGLFAGLSNAILDYVYLNCAYKQSLECIAIGKKQSRRNFFRFEDFLLISLIDNSERFGVPPLSICHPTIIAMAEYDEEYGTEFLKTLALYVQNSLSLQQTADDLHIHRNTLYHRINMMKDLFYINFDDPVLITHFRISVAAYSQLGKLKIFEYRFG